MPDDDRPDPAALAYVLRELRRTMDDGDAREPHAVIVTDPQTGRRSVIGLYRDRLHARVGASLELARMVTEDPDLADLITEVVIASPPSAGAPGLSAPAAAQLRLHGAGDGSVMAYCGACREPLPSLPRPATLQAVEDAWGAHLVTIHGPAT